MNQSQNLFERAQTLIPGGVSSPVRAFKSVGGTPIFFKSGQGAYLQDVDNQQYIDYVGSWGPLIVGHCHPAVVLAIVQQAEMGTSFGAPIEVELKLAEKIIRHMPSIEKIRMVNSGTEATMTAIRLARAYTGRNKILKFTGCYHGHSDSLLVKAGSGALTLGVPSSPGVPDCLAELTLTAEFNDINSVEALFEAYHDEIAAIIVEPVAGNMGFVLPEEGFLSELRAICDKHQSLLIFDEVMTGFRVALGGAQSVYDIKPDITTLGKVIGGGLPVGALGGREDIMSCLAPVGTVYQAGTLSGNPLAMSAGLATLSIIEAPGFYEALAQKTKALVRGLKQAADNAGLPFSAASLGAMFGFCFSHQAAIRNYQDVVNSDAALFNGFYHAMLEKGVYFAPSMFEAGFVSSAHTDADIQQTIARTTEVFAALN